MPANSLAGYGNQTNPLGNTLDINIPAPQTRKISQEEFERLKQEQPTQKEVTDFKIVPSNTLPQEGVTQELSPREISKRKFKENRLERKRRKEKSKYDDYAFGELTRQFKNARRKKNLVDEEELVNLANNISTPELKEKAGKLIEDVKNSNKRIQGRSEFTLENLSQKRFGSRNLNSLDDEQQQNLLNEYNSMKKQGITAFKQPELVKPQLKPFESEVTDAVQKRSIEEVLQRQPEKVDIGRSGRGRVERKVQGKEVTEEEKGKPGREEEKEERGAEKEAVPEEVSEPEFTDKEIYDKAISLYELPPKLLNDNDIEEIKNELRKEKNKKVSNEAKSSKEESSGDDRESLTDLISVLEPKRKELEAKYGKLEDLSEAELRNIANRKESKETITPKVENVPISSIKTDEDRFQNRALSYSPRTVKAIEENYNPAKFDPVVLWKDPEDNNTYVLSGHSRLEGMKRRNAGNIPARYFEGSEDEAVKFARLESNRSASKESLLEDIKAYKYAVENNVPKKELQETFANGQYRALEDLSRLSDKGQFLSNLNSDNKEAFPYLERNARWVGQLRAEYPGLTDAHEDEMFDFFYREKNKNLRIKKDDFFNTVEKQVNRADFSEDKSLMLDSAGKTTGVRARADTADLQKQIDELAARKKEAITDKERDALDSKIEKLKDNIREITSSQLTFLEEREKYGVQKPLSKEFIHEQLALFNSDDVQSDIQDYKNISDSELEDQKIDGPYKHSFVSLARMNLHYRPTPLQKTLGRYAFGYDLLILDNDLQKNDFKTISYKALKKAREAAQYNLKEAPGKYSKDEISEIKNLRNYKKHLELVIPELEKQWFKNNGIEYNRKDASFRQFELIDYSRTKAVDQLREKWAGYGDKEAVRLIDAKSELYKTNKAIERLQKSVKKQSEVKGQQDIFQQSKGEPEELFGTNVESELKPAQVKQEQLKLFEKNGRIRRSIYDREKTFGGKTQNQNTLTRLQDDLKNAKADIKFNVEYEGTLPKRTIPEEARAVLKEFREKGEVSLVGLQLGSNYIQDIADAYKIYRDPFIEVAHIIGRDNNNKIVANVSYTSGASNYIYYRQSQFDDVIDSLKSRGAKKVTILHNHPSGNPKPSKADVTLSSFLRDKFKKGNLDLDSSVVIDGDKYSAWTLSDDAAIKPKMYRYKSPKKHPLEEFYKKFDSFPKIKLDSDMAPMYLAQLKYGDGNAAVVVTDNNLRVRGYEYVHKDILADGERFSEYMDKVLKSHGGATAFIAGKEGDIQLPEVKEKPDNAGIYEAKSKKTLRSEYSYEPVKATIIYRDNDAVQVFEYKVNDNLKLAERINREDSKNKSSKQQPSPDIKTGGKQPQASKDKLVKPSQDVNEFDSSQREESADYGKNSAEKKRSSGKKISEYEKLDGNSVDIGRGVYKIYDKSIGKIKGKLEDYQAGKKLGLYDGIGDKIRKSAVGKHYKDWLTNVAWFFDQNPQLQRVWDVVDQHLVRNINEENAILTEDFWKNGRPFRKLGKAGKAHLMQAFDRYINDLYNMKKEIGKARRLTYDQFVKKYQLKGETKDFFLNVFKPLRQKQIELIEDHDKYLIVNTTKDNPYLEDHLLSKNHDDFLDKAKEDFFAAAPKAEGLFRKKLLEQKKENGSVDEVKALNDVWNENKEIREIAADDLVEEKYKDWRDKVEFPTSRLNHKYYVSGYKPFSDIDQLMYGYKSSGDKVFYTTNSLSEAHRMVEELKSDEYLEPRFGEFKKMQDVILQNAVTTEDLIDLVVANDINVDNETVTRLLNSITAKGFTRHFIEKNYIPGFEFTPENFEKALVRNMNGVVHFKNRTIGLNELKTTMQELKKDGVIKEGSNEADYLNKLRVQLDSQDYDAFRALRSAASVWYLTRPAYYAQQSFQPFQTLLPYLPVVEKELGLKRGAGEKAFGEAVIKAHEYYGWKIVDKVYRLANKKLNTTFGIEKEFLDIIKRLERQGVGRPLRSLELSGQIVDPQRRYNLNPVTEGMSYIGMAAGTPGILLEDFTRAIGIRAFYNLGKKAGLAGGDLLNMISNNIAKTYGPASGKLSKPPGYQVGTGGSRETMVTKGWRSLTNAYLTFKNFGFMNYGQWGKVWRVLKNDKLYRAMLYKAASSAGVSGFKFMMWNSSVMFLLRTIADFLNWEESPEEKIHDLVKKADEIVPNLGTVLYKGLASTLFKVDLSSLFSQSAPFISEDLMYYQDNVSEAVGGAPMQVMKDLARILETRDFMSGAPTGVRNIQKAEEWEERGVRYGTKTLVEAARNKLTRSELRQLRKQANELGIDVDDLILGAADILKKKMGFTPMKVSNAYERENARKFRSQQFSDRLRRKISDEIIPLIDARRNRNARVKLKELFKEAKRLNFDKNIDKLESYQLDRFVSQIVNRITDEEDREKIRNYRDNFLKMKSSGNSNKINVIR